jgi:hypothetical protein
MRSTRIAIFPRLASAAALAALVAGALSTAASANGTQTPTVPDCPSQTLVQPFLPWHDQGSYFLAPGGDFESTPAGWTLTGSAQIAAGNESSHVNGAGDANSLSLPTGSSATSPQICVTIHSPNLRLFSTNAGSRWSSLGVSVNYTDKRGVARTMSIGALRSGSAWSLSPQLLFVNRIAPAVGGHGQTWVSFTFTPTMGGAWRIDDVYVDPLKSQ